MATPVVTITPDTPQVTITPDVEPQAPSTYSKLTSGYNQNAEDFAQAHPLIGPVVRFLDAAGGAAMATPEGVYQALRHPSDTAKAALSSIAAWKDPATRAGALGVLPEALGQGVGNVAASEATPPALRATAKGIGDITPDAINLAAKVKANKAALMTAADVIQHPEQIPGRIAKEVIKRIPDPKAEPVPVVSKDPFALTSPDTGTEPAIQTSLFPQPPDIKGGPASFKKLTLSPGEDLGLGMGSEHTITNPQGQRIGSAQIEMKPDGVAHVHWLGGDFSDYGRKDVMGAIKEAYPDAETITYDRRRLAKGADAATTQPRQMNVAQAPSVNDVANQVVANTTGVKPLERDVPLNQQGNATPKSEPSTPVSGEPDPLKVKYPDPAQRQMVRANGEGIVQAIGGDKDTMKAVHDLTRVDLRQALINSGEDMGQRTVSNSKFAGKGSITREDAFNRLLAKGIKPSDIVRLAKQGQEQVSK